MGSDPNGILAYGISLGSGEDIDTDDLPWYIDDEGLSESIEIALLASVGFTETWATSHPRLGFYDRRKAAQVELGVEVVRTGAWDYPGFILAVTQQRVEWSEVAVADLTVPDGAAERLARALAALPGLTPANADPAWLLAAFYG